MRINAVTAIAVCMLAGVNSCRAELIAADSFDVVEGGALRAYHFGSLIGQVAPTPGWSKDSPWLGNAAELGLDPMSLAPEASTYPGGGGRAWFNATGHNRFSHLTRKLDRSAGEEYWACYLVHAGWQYLPEADAAKYWLLGFVSGADEKALEIGSATRMSGILIGFTGRLEDDAVDLVARYADPSGLLREQILTTDLRKGAHMVLVHVLPRDGMAEVTVIVDPLDIQTETAAMDSALVTKRFDARLDGESATIDRFAVVAKDWDRKAFFDEIRLATRFDDLSADPARTPVRGVLAAAIGLCVAVRLVRRTGRTPVAEEVIKS